MAKDTYEEHQKRMLKILEAPVPTPPLVERIKGAIRKRKLPKIGM